MKKICIICLNEFPCFDSPESGGRGAGIKARRPAKSYTCNRLCARKYSKLRITEKGKKIIMENKKKIQDMLKNGSRP
jgi:hypothetical protein